jgi:hypothetical protein
MSNKGNIEIKRVNLFEEPLTFNEVGLLEKAAFLFELVSDYTYTNNHSCSFHCVLTDHVECTANESEGY